MDSKELIPDGSNNIPIAEIAPDLVGYKEIPTNKLALGQKNR